MRLIPELKKKLNLTTLEDRWARKDVITTYKILRGINKADRDRLLRGGKTGTQGYSWKLRFRQVTKMLRSFLQSQGSCKWNGCDEEEVNSIHSFKNRYNRAYKARSESGKWQVENQDQKLKFDLCNYIQVRAHVGRHRGMMRYE